MAGTGRLGPGAAYASTLAAVLAVALLAPFGAGPAYAAPSYKVGTRTFSGPQQITIPSGASAPKSLFRARHRPQRGCRR